MRLRYIILSLVIASAAFGYSLVIFTNIDTIANNKLDRESCEYNLIESGRMRVEKKFYALWKAYCVNAYAARYAIGPGETRYLAEVTPGLIKQQRVDTLPQGVLILETDFLIASFFRGDILYLSTRTSNVLYRANISNEPSFVIQLLD